MRGQAAETESLAVHLDSGTVELDRLFDGRATDRYITELIGHSEQEHVRGDRIAEQLQGIFVRVQRSKVTLADAV